MPTRVRDRVLTATVTLIEQSGFDAVNIAAVASRAGVSRQTIYTNFTSLDLLIRDVVSTVAIAVLAEVRTALTGVDTPESYVVELFVACRTAIREHPVLSRLLERDGANPLSDAGVMERALPFAREVLAPMLAMDARYAPHVDSVVEMVVRLGLSTVLLDSELLATDAGLRRFVAEWIGPGLRAFADRL